MLHLHHGVWAVATRRDATSVLFPERFIAAGEEKTALELPDGYGYRYAPSDYWYLNYMIHNLTAKPYQVSITYDVDFVPASWPGIRAGRRSLFPAPGCCRGALPGVGSLPGQWSSLLGARQLGPHAAIGCATPGSLCPGRSSSYSPAPSQPAGQVQQAINRAK